jgi:hypothetical protein
MINAIVVNPESDRCGERVKITEKDWLSESMLVPVTFAQGAWREAPGMIYRRNLRERA